jgi:hypothetical protein
MGKIVAFALGLGLLCLQSPAEIVRAGAPPPIPRSADCTHDCIKDFSATPHGTYADVVVHVPGRVKEIRVEAHEDGKFSVDTKYDYSGGTEFKTSLIHLKPNTKYIYTVKATDINGNVHEESDSFKTLHRNVTITFTDIRVLAEIDESQTYYFDAGAGWDLAFPFKVDLNTHDHANPGYTAYYPNAPDTLLLRVFGRDDNCDDFEATLCVEGIVSPNGGGPDHGVTDEQAWTTAYKSVYTASGANGPGEVHTDGVGNISFPGIAYEFQITASVFVDYS